MHVGTRGSARESGKAGKSTGKCRQRGRAWKSTEPLHNHQIMATEAKWRLWLKAAAMEQLAKRDPRIALEVALSEIGVRRGASN